MNKKLLFAAMSLAALTACTNDDFESQTVAEEASPIQFEVINDATRASMNGNTVVFSAADGDLFTLYHGGTVAADPAPLTGYENATYKATADPSTGVASLTTPSMIKQGKAIMTWPSDTVFRASGNLSIVIPVTQTSKIQNEIPYVSDLIDILPYAAYSETGSGIPTAYKTAGYNRKYSVYMRPMASQLNLKANYAGTDQTIAQLYEGAPGVATGEGIDPIRATSVDLLTTTGGGTTDFTKEIPLTFQAKSGADNTRWNAAAPNNRWSHVTKFDVAGITAGGKVDKLTSKCPLNATNTNSGCKFLILPQATISGGVENAGIVVNTIYGKVVIADPSGANPHKTQYDATEYANAWYRYVAASNRITTATTEENVSATTAEASGDNAGKYKTVAKGLAYGMQQTINYMSTYKAKASLPVVESEPIGVALTRYVNVNLEHLDMSDLHIKNDKQLRDAARVWKKMNLTDVTVYLDGDANEEFTISQKTIKVINDINASIAGGTKSFKVMPCNVPGEKCTDIVITGASEIQTLQDIAFIEAGDNGTKADPSDDIKANVVLKNETTAWKWNVDATTKAASIKVQSSAVTRIINKGTILNDADATIKILEKDGTPTTSVAIRNDNKWNVTSGKLFVQFTVSNTNGGVLTISENAEYRQDGAGHIFYNWANQKPTRFGGDDTKNGKVINNGVFATVNGGRINNYSLIEHANENAKTYISSNQVGGNFASAFNSSTNKMGTINLPYSNREEDNISINAAAEQGFVSVTVSAADAPADGILNADVVGARVNYINVIGGIKSIAKVSDQVKYVEINQPGTEVVWDLEAPKTATYDGLMVLSPVNIKLNTEIQVTKACYLGADMYVGGKFYNGTWPTLPSWNGYYGDTSGNTATMYVTY